MTEFTLAESLKAQKAMRDELGLGEERFAIPQFVGMVSDEIEQLRKKGWSDGQIATLVSTSTVGIWMQRRLASITCSLMIAKRN